jgi:Fic family protein
VPDDKHLLCAPEEKAQREVNNGLAQLEYIEHLIGTLKITEVRASHVRTLKALAIEGIYPCGDQYRDAFRQVRIEGSRHELPHESRVPSLVDEMVDKLNRDRAAGVPAIERSAYAIWRTNWIHPFPGGNGRTARAVGYLELCIDIGKVLGGEPQFPTLIYDAAGDYTRALRAADASEKETGEADVSQMAALVRDAITRQLQSLLGAGGVTS